MNDADRTKMLDTLPSQDESDNHKREQPPSLAAADHRTDGAPLYQRAGSERPDIRSKGGEVTNESQPLPASQGVTPPSPAALEAAACPRCASVGTTEELMGHTCRGRSAASLPDTPIPQSVYLSGPMTGIPEFNYPAFGERAAVWREAGWHVRNPAEHFGGSMTESYGAYMRKDIQDLLEVEAIALLPGWEKSNGATLELSVARVLGLTVLDAMTFAPLVPSPAPPQEPARSSPADREALASIVYQAFCVRPHVAQLMRQDLWDSEHPEGVTRTSCYDVADAVLAAGWVRSSGAPPARTTSDQGGVIDALRSHCQ